MHALVALRAVIAIATLLLAAVFVRQAFVTAAIEDERPGAALWLDPTNPDVLAGAAADRASSAKSDAEFKSAGRLANAALQGSPLEPSALRVLSWQADHEGRPDVGLAIMTLAGQLTQRDNYIHGTLFWDAVARRDWLAAFLNVDPVLRRAPELGPAFFPAMIGALSDPEGRRAAVSRLVWRPEWRGPFLNAVAHDPNSIAPARLLFAALNATRAPPSPSEQALLLDDLVSAGDYAEAKEAWEGFLPDSRRETALLYDGDFKQLPGGPPFNWTFVDDGGAVSEIGQAPSGEPGLHLQYPADHASQLLSQTLVLPTGDYHFDGLASFDGSARGDQLNWRVICVNGPVLGEQRQGASGPGWAPIKLDFAVPPAGCAAQRLELSSLSQDRFGSLDAYVKHLTIGKDGPG